MDFRAVLVGPRWWWCLLAMGSVFLIVADWNRSRDDDYYAAGVLHVGCREERECHLLLGFDLHVSAWSDFGGYREPRDDAYPDLYPSSMVTSCREMVEETVGLVRRFGRVDECLAELRSPATRRYSRYDRSKKSTFVSYVAIVGDGYDATLPARFQSELAVNRTRLTVDQLEKIELRWFPIEVTLRQVNRTCCSNLHAIDATDDGDDDIEEKEAESIVSDTEFVVVEALTRVRGAPCRLRDGTVLRRSMVANWCQGLRDGFWDDLVRWDAALDGRREKTLEKFYQTVFLEFPGFLDRLAHQQLTRVVWHHGRHFLDERMVVYERIWGEHGWENSDTRPDVRRAATVPLEGLRISFMMKAFVGETSDSFNREAGGSSSAVFLFLVGALPCATVGRELSKSMTGFSRASATGWRGIGDGWTLSRDVCT
jgi:hypothetical protein